jgi:predicted nucleic acid-binding protein
VNGDRLLLDTNAIIYFLEGRSRIAEYILLAETLYYSVITEIELLSAPHLTDDDAGVIREFPARCQRIDLTPDVIEQTIHIRRAVRCKTPDAIVAASALVLDIPLFTADTQFDRITGLNLVTDILE